MSRTRRYAVVALALVVVAGMPFSAGLLAGQAAQPEAGPAGAGQPGINQPGAGPPEDDGQPDEGQSTWLLLAVMITGMATLGVFALRMSRAQTQNGIGPYDLKAAGIVLIATIVGLLVASRGDVPTSAATILGAIAGYLFGTKTPDPSPGPPGPKPPAPNPPGPADDDGGRRAG